MFPSDLIALSEQRLKILPEIRPSFISYKKKYHRFPDSLQHVLPEYLNQIPELFSRT